MFSIGFSPTSGRAKSKTSKKRRVTSKKSSLSYREIDVPPFNEWGNTWCILPNGLFSENVRRILLPTKTYLEALDVFNMCKLIKNPFNNSKWALSTRGKIKHSRPVFFYYNTPSFIKEVDAFICKNQEIRWKIKQLTNPWRLSRFNEVNTEDPVTMEAPVTPINLYDWSTRSKYVFDAKSLIRDIGSRLLHVSEWEVINPEPLPPRNMLTNVPLTIGQTQFILEKLLMAGISSWDLLAYKSSGYSLEEFERVHKQALKISALKRLFSKPDSAACIELTLDFIEYQYEENQIEFDDIRAWKWYMQQPDDSYKESFRALCYEYYAFKDTNFERIASIKVRAAKLIRSSQRNVYRMWKLSASYREVPQVMIIEWGGEDPQLESLITAYYTYILEPLNNDEPSLPGAGDT